MRLICVDDRVYTDCSSKPVVGEFYTMEFFVPKELNDMNEDSFMIAELIHCKHGDLTMYPCLDFIEADEPSDEEVEEEEIIEIFAIPLF